jgi:hypothetical protein
MDRLLGLFVLFCILIAITYVLINDSSIFLELFGFKKKNKIRDISMGYIESKKKEPQKNKIKEE